MGTDRLCERIFEGKWSVFLGDRAYRQIVACCIARHRRAEAFSSVIWTRVRATIAASLLGAFFLQSCVTATGVQREEIRLYSKHDVLTYDGSLAYTHDLAEAYIQMADRASSAQDAAALGIIAAAGVAAGGILYDAQLDLVKGAGLTAGFITGTTSYFRPGEASESLLDAAEQLLCINKAGSQFPPRYRSDAEAMEILRSGLTTVRLNLRKRLKRILPDYKGLISELKTALATDGVNGLADVPGSVAGLRAAVASCLL